MRGLVALALLAGCIDIADVHRCTDNAACVRDGVGGRCEASGFCSFADATCGGEGFRYHQHAGDHANVCVVSGTVPSDVDDTELVRDQAQTSCGIAGARDLYVEINSPVPQVVFIDTVHPATNTGAVIAVKMGPCPGTTETGCRRLPCGDVPYGQLATQIGPGTSCIIVEETVPGTAEARVGLRVVPAGRVADSLDPMTPVAGSTCQQPNNQAAYVFATCPGGTTQMMATVDPVDGSGFDVALAVRAMVPQGQLLNAAGAAGPEQPEMIGVMLGDPGAYWLIVDRMGGPACGQFTVTSAISRITALRP